MRGPVVITGGGTGGHVFPMRALADALVARGLDPTALHFVGSRRGQERELLAGVAALTLLPGRGLRRSWGPRALVANAVAVVALAVAQLEALWLVAKWRPSVVVSVGGYASAATSVAAWLWRRPLVLVEFDAVPGAAQRLVRRAAVARCRAFPDDGANVVLTGAPVRGQLEAIDRSREAVAAAKSRATPPIDPARLVVVAMSGSLGARRVNDAVAQLAALWAERGDRAIVQVTGRRDYARFAAPAALEGLDYRVVEFGDMAELWALADLAICRAGALSVAELCAVGIASVLVPLPGAPGDHQSENARLLADAGAAIVLDDARCSGANLAEALEPLTEAKACATMGERAHGLARVGASDAIAEVVLRSRAP